MLGIQNLVLPKYEFSKRKVGSNDLLAETKAIFKISAYFHNWSHKNDQDTFFSNDQ